MAIKAMVFRLQQLRRIDMDHSRSLYKQISARGWNKNEPMEVGNEGAIWLAKVSRSASPVTTRSHKLLTAPEFTVHISTPGQVGNPTWKRRSSSYIGGLTAFMDTGRAGSPGCESRVGLTPPPKAI